MVVARLRLASLGFSSPLRHLGVAFPYAFAMYKIYKLQKSESFTGHDVGTRILQPPCRFVNVVWCRTGRALVGIGIKILFHLINCLPPLLVPCQSLSLPTDASLHSSVEIHPVLTKATCYRPSSIPFLAQHITSTHHLVFKTSLPVTSTYRHIPPLHHPDPSSIYKGDMLSFFVHSPTTSSAHIPITSSSKRRCQLASPHAPSPFPAGCQQLVKLRAMMKAYSVDSGR
ncbi:hypothetical protein BJ165DRAFT_233492 [Panaeolus papilionaceus]|nr:hypothetical protein BJ165DRAFT_233492 [Panaeolus papilionaceus]